MTIDKDNFEFELDEVEELEDKRDDLRSEIDSLTDARDELLDECQDLESKRDELEAECVDLDPYEAVMSALRRCGLEWHPQSTGIHITSLDAAIVWFIETRADFEAEQKEKGEDERIEIIDGQHRRSTIPLP